MHIYVQHHKKIPIVTHDIYLLLPYLVGPSLFSTSIQTSYILYFHTYNASCFS